MLYRISLSVRTVEHEDIGAALAGKCARGNGIVLHPPPRKWGRGTTLRSRVVEGAF